MSVSLPDEQLMSRQAARSRMIFRLLFALAMVLLAMMQAVSARMVILEARGKPPRNVNAHNALYVHETWGKLLQHNPPRSSFKPSRKPTQAAQATEKYVMKKKASKPVYHSGSHSPDALSVNLHGRPTSPGSQSTASSASSPPHSAHGVDATLRLG